MPSIKILNKTYEIKCQMGEEASLQQAADTLNDELRAIRQKHRHLDDVQTMMLAAMNLAHQLNETRIDQEKQRQQMSRFIETLEQKVKQVVVEHS